jgi:ABC-2 type transport system permease protein
MLGRLRHMLIKEFTQVLRDKRTRFVLIVPPMLQMLIFGYAATLEIKHVPTAIVDYDNTRVSRDLISRFAASRYFQVRQLPADRRQIPSLIDRGDVILAIQINEGFARLLGKGETAPMQVVVDASSSNTALIGLGYVNRVAANFAQEIQATRLRRSAPMLVSSVPHIALDQRPLYNVDISDRWFFIPGVIGNLIMVVVMNLTAFAIVREREIGTLEQIMVTPIRRVEFILGKTVPFFLIGLFDAILVAAFGTLWFGVPLRGSIGVLALGTTLFLMCVLAIGLFISTISRTQQQAMVTAFFFIMPAILFSGFGSPISSMPESMQWLTYLNPLRYFQEVLRSVYLKGTGLAALWQEMAAMGLLSVIMLAISVLRFQKSLD